MASWPWVFGTLPAGNVAASKLDDNFNAAAQLDSPALTGTPTSTTPPASDNSTRIATTAYVTNAVISQIVTATTTSLVTCPTNIPQDDTIPQNTAGDEVLTVTITPKSATSKLVIQIGACCSSTGSNNGAAALFQDSGSNALAVRGFWSPASGTVNVSMTYVMTSGTTSATTFKLRIGGTGGSTVYVNGVAGTRVWGGTALTNFVVTEFNT